MVSKQICDHKKPKLDQTMATCIEVISGYLNLAINLKTKKNLNGEAFNFGPKNIQNKRVIDVIKEIKKISPKVKWKIKRKKTFKESQLLKLNSSKARKKLSWKNRLSFNETIEMTTKWYEMFYKNKSMSNFTSKQIEEYRKKL